MTRALLLHGLGSDASSWWRLGGRLEELGFDVTAPDQRGHGTAPDGDRYAFDDYADDLAGTGPWDLVVGHSLGGAVAVRSAARDAAWARRLVLLDPVLLIPEADRAEVRAGQVAELDATEAHLTAASPHWHPRDVAAKLSGIRHVSRDVPGRTVDDNAPWDVTADAAALRLPVLVLSGDPAVFTFLVPAVRDAVLRNPAAEYRIVAGAGHAPHRDRPEATHAEIEGWLAAS